MNKKSIKAPPRAAVYYIPMHSSSFLKSKLFLAIIISIVLFLGLVVYAYVRMNTLSNRVDTLATAVSSLAANLASTTQFLQASIHDTDASLSNTLASQQQNVGIIQQQLGTFQNQVGSISGTISTLQKLSQLDPELLEKYSKIYFLNENYVPKELSEIPSTYRYSDSKALLIEARVLPHVEAMESAASSSGVTFYAFSAYRSFDEQKALKGEYTMTYGAGTANSFSADQGYSEHQLGTALDFIAPGQGGVLDGFDQTPAYKWMLNNAYLFGFILSYPKNNGYYEYEPWHWRFVGIKLATDLHNQGKNFYDLDQRTIDTYLPNIFD